MTKKDLLPSTRLYFQEEIKGKHPISPKDAEIFIEIFLAVKKGRKMVDLAQLMRQYKKVDDDLLLDQLVGFNVDNQHLSADEDKEDEDGNVKRKTYSLEIGGNILFIMGIKNLRKISEYDYIMDRMKYGVMINPLPPDATSSKDPYANMAIWFNSEEHRDEEWNSIKVVLEAKHNVIFL